jgi:hypothetical protein
LRFPAPRFQVVKTGYFARERLTRLARVAHFASDKDKAVNNIDLLSQQTIETIHDIPPLMRRRPAHRFGDFAVHRPDGFFNDGWRITHLPTGRYLADGFSTFERAIGAMIEVARLRNDWAVDGWLSDGIRDKCNEIVASYGGHVGMRKDELYRRPAFNGYASKCVFTADSTSR